jgi:hypothetical protein
VKAEKAIRYKLTVDGRYRVLSPCGRPHFVHPVTIPSPKIYVVSCDNRILYVGSTCQPIARRLYGGFTAKGESGYHGYAWRTHGSQMLLDIWIVTLNSGVEILRELETIEAEVVFCIRQRSGNWPPLQTEIHFHQSTNKHRNLAVRIYDFATSGG